jgi:hypothetical protein
MLPGYAQHTSAMLSTLPHWDSGSHGGMGTSYALKIATRPQKGTGFPSSRDSVCLVRKSYAAKAPLNNAGLMPHHWSAAR